MFGHCFGFMRFANDVVRFVGIWFTNSGMQRIGQPFKLQQLDFDLQMEIRASFQLLQSSPNLIIDLHFIDSKNSYYSFIKQSLHPVLYFHLEQEHCP